MAAQLWQLSLALPLSLPLDHWDKASGPVTEFDHCGGRAGVRWRRLVDHHREDLRLHRSVCMRGVHMDPSLPHLMQLPLPNRFCTRMTTREPARKKHKSNALTTDSGTAAHTHKGTDTNNPCATRLIGRSGSSWPAIEAPNAIMEMTSSAVDVLLSGS